MAGRLASRHGFVQAQLRGLWTRQQREYFIASLALQDNPDRERASRIWEKMLAARTKES